jgi:O-acetyl-ADP-ribose deacetylase (regulator of RNase III)
MTAITSDSISAMRVLDAEYPGGTTGNRAFPLRSLNEWQVEALRKFAALSLLPENWNSYGSRRISDQVLDVASELISKISVEGIRHVAVSPISAGGIQLEWDNRTRELTVEVRSDGSYGVLLVDGEHIDELSLPTLSPGVLESLLRWVATVEP